MTRARSGKTVLRCRARLRKLTKGFRLGRHKLYRSAKEAADRAGNFSYIGRRLKKRDFRRLWIVRINAAARIHGLSYSQLINGLKRAEVAVDRKVLADLAVHEPKTFAALAERAKAALAQ